MNLKQHNIIADSCSKVIHDMPVISVMANKLYHK